MPHPLGPWALVTGASSGIGRATCLELARAGLDVVLVARRADALDTLAAEIRALGRAARPLPLDLSAPDAIARMATQTRDLDVGVVIHAAGFGLGGPHEQHGLDEHLALLDLNSRCALEIAHRFRARLAARDRAALVLVASVIGFSGVPWSANYAASKAYVLALAEALAVEWRPQGIAVLAIAPGPTRTAFFERAAMTAGATVSPDAVARHTVRSLGRRGVRLGDRLAWAIRLAMLTAPRALGVHIMGRIMQGMTAR